ncbi:hypothetical protein ABVT39_021380 [Epinephelus coioides]
MRLRYKSDKGWADIADGVRWTAEDDPGSCGHADSPRLASEAVPGNTFSGVTINRKQVDDDDFHKMKDKLINGFCDNLTTQFGNLVEGASKAAATMFDLRNWPEGITDLAGRC